MDVEVAKIVAVTAYKICSLVVGMIIAYMGYKLFMAGVQGNAGNAEGKFGQNSFFIREAAPGTFFAILGAAVIIATISTGLKFDSSITVGRQIDEKPPLNLDDQ